jgi:hypothetical protein
VLKSSDVTNHYKALSNDDFKLDETADGATGGQRCFVASIRGYKDLKVLPGSKTGAKFVVFIQSEMIRTPDWLFWPVWIFIMVVLLAPLFNIMRLKNKR